MASSTENVKIGVCRLYYDGEDLGYTKGGVSVNVTTETYEVKVDQFGESPISENITARSVTVSAPLAETTLENMVRIMPGATLITDGKKATGHLFLGTSAQSANPADADAFTIGTTTFTFKATPSGDTHIKIGATWSDTMKNAVEKLNASIDVKSIVSISSTQNRITFTAKSYGVDGNSIVLSKTGNILETRAPLVTSPVSTTLKGGATGTTARVDVKTGIGTNMLSLAKELRLRPLAFDVSGDSSEDFVIPKAATAGALEFSYNHDSERVFNVDFKGYPDTTNGDVLFRYGNT